MSSLAQLLSNYPILQSFSSSLTTLDLYHLGLTCKTIHSFVLSPKGKFDILRRNCLCDGHGLAERQAFIGMYSVRYRFWGGGRHISRDEPIEVRLYATNCDEASTLPCCKCGINVCEECRYYSRERPEHPDRRPHLNACWQTENIMCLCSNCDPILEDELRGRFLNELCDCDTYTRWICLKCVEDEHKFHVQYYNNHTKSNYGWSSDTKKMGDHQHIRDFYCTCGGLVPQDMRPRCTQCRRRHLPEDEWVREWREIGSRMPMFENDPCYPFYEAGRYAPSINGLYPKLPYDGPIWQV